MEVILIAAVTANGMIARHRHEVVDWSLDLALFKKQTKGFPVILGSNTFDTLAVDLEGREIIVVHRNDDPVRVINRLKAERCFIIGGSRTYGRFAPFLTQIYLTFHPLVFADGIPLFTGLKNELNLQFIAKIPVLESAGIYQFQFKIIKQ